MRLRSEFFHRYPFSSRDGIDDYLCFKLVALELLLYAEHTEGGGTWRTFVSEGSPYSESNMWALRQRLAEVAEQLNA